MALRLRSLVATISLAVSLGPAVSTPRAGPEESALFVGNFVPNGTTNGILRYDAAGAFVDYMVPVGTGGLTIACCMAFGPDENLYVGSPLGSLRRTNGLQATGSRRRL